MKKLENAVIGLLVALIIGSIATQLLARAPAEPAISPIVVALASVPTAAGRPDPIATASVNNAPAEAVVGNTQGSWIAMPGMFGSRLPVPSTRTETIEIQPASPTDEQKQQIEANDKLALERLKRLANGGELFASGEQIAVNGFEQITGGYRFSAFVYSEASETGTQAIRTQAKATDLVLPVAESVSYYVMAWPDGQQTGGTAFVLDKTGEIASNSGSNARGPSGMTSSCACGDRFAKKGGSARAGLGPDRNHGGEWKIAYSPPSVQ